MEYILQIYQIMITKCTVVKEGYRMQLAYHIKPDHRFYWRRCPVKKVFLEISQNSQESKCARIYF